MIEDIISRRLKALVAFRVMFVTVLLGTFFVFQIGFAVFPYPYAVLYLIVVMYSLSIVYALLLGRVASKPFALVQLLIDVVAIIVLIFITGGIESWFSWMLLLAVISGAMVSGKRVGFYVATLGALLYGILLDLQFYDILPIPIPYDINLIERDFFYKIFLHISALYLMAYLTGELTSRLERKDRDIKDLTLFNKEVIENTPSGLLTTDMRGTVKVFNRAAEQITGMTRSEAIGRDVYRIMPFLEGLPIDKRMEAAVDFDGQRKVIGMSFSLMRDAAGTEMGYIGVFQDLTELKRLSEDVKKKEKLAAVGELSAKIAHEIRNPLASLRGSMEMLMESGMDEARKERLMGIALREMDRLNGTITELLDYTRPGVTKIVDFDLNGSLSEVFELLRNCDTNGVNFSRQFDGQLMVRADRGKLHQVFWNLGINALEALEPVGGGEFTIRSEAADDRVRIVFEDTGPGIAKEDLQRVFFPFYTTKRNGTGLGLSVALHIVEEHGGSLDIESPPGGGTRFIIEMPRWGRHDA